MENTSEVIIKSKLKEIYTRELKPRLQLAAANSLYLAVNRCRDMVHVTDDKHQVLVRWKMFIKKFKIIVYTLVSFKM